MLGHACKHLEIVKLLLWQPFLFSLDWTERDVVDNYLKPIGMEFMAKAFMENHITGAVLLALKEEHIKELGCAVLGDRILFMEYLALLKKHKKDLDRSKALWSAQTPVNSCAYHENCGKYLWFLVCGCCVRKVEWRITGQGIRWRKLRAAIDCCGEGSINLHVQCVCNICTIIINFMDTRTELSISVLKT